MFNKYSRFTFTLLLFGVFIISGIYTRNNIQNKYSSVDEYVLKKFPNINKFISISGEQVFPDFNSGVFVHFWATWCGPCEAELPEFIKFSNDLPESKFMIIASKDDISKVKKTINKIGTFNDNLIYIFDEDGEIMRSFGTLKLPETYLFDRNKDIVKKFIGPQEWANSYFLQNFRYLSL